MNPHTWLPVLVGYLLQPLLYQPCVLRTKLFLKVLQKESGMLSHACLWKKQALLMECLQLCLPGLQSWNWVPGSVGVYLQGSGKDEIDCPVDVTGVDIYPLVFQFWL